MYETNYCGKFFEPPFLAVSARSPKLKIWTIHFRHETIGIFFPSVLEEGQTSANPNPLSLTVPGTESLT